MTRAVLTALLCAGCASSAASAHHPPHPPPDWVDHPVIVERWTMGTRLRVIAYGPEHAVTAALDEADRLDALLSTFRPASALSVLNASAGRRVAVPWELVRFLRTAAALAERTGGAFDPTVGPLVAASQPHPRRPWRSAPEVAGDPGSGDPEAIAAARALVGFRNLVFHGDAEVELRLAGMAIDPGGIGKGWAVDAMVSRLRATGVGAAFIDFGQSSFYGLGAPPGQPGWAVRLRDAGGAPVGPDLILHNVSLSTSMSLALPEEPGAAPRPHIVDPRGGSLVTTPRLAAVVSPSATEADALSTALVVLGPEGLGILDTFPGAAAWIHEAGRPPASRGDLPVRPASRAP